MVKCYSISQKRAGQKILFPEHLPRFDAWKLSCGDIISTCAVSLERGSIDLSEFILSTA